MNDSIAQRICKKCNTSYPLTPEFWHKDKKAKEGLSYSCKECAKAKSRAWHHENQEYANQRSSEWHASHLDEVREYRAENAEKIAQQKREWRQNNPEKVKEHKKRDYEKRKQEISAYYKLWRQANIDHLHEYGRQYYLEHSDVIRLRSAIWYSNNKARAAKINAANYQKNKQRIKDRIRAWGKRNPDKVKLYSKASTHNRRALKIAAEGHFTTEDVLLAYRAQRGRCWHCGCKVDKDYHADHLISLKNGGTNWPNNIVVSCSDCNLSKGAKFCYQWNGRLF